MVIGHVFKFHLPGQKAETRSILLLPNPSAQRSAQHSVGPQLTCRLQAQVYLAIPTQALFGYKEYNPHTLK